MTNINKKYIFAIILIAFFVFLYVNNSPDKLEFKKTVTVDNGWYCNYDLTKRYIIKDTLIRSEIGFKKVILNNYNVDTISEYKKTKYKFTLKDSVQDALIKISYDCTKNIFLDYYILKNGNEFRVQSSFSKDNTLSHRYVLLTDMTDYKRFLTDTEQIQTILNNPYLLLENKYFYGLKFTKDTVIDFNDKRYILKDNQYLHQKKKKHHFDSDEY